MNIKQSLVLLILLSKILFAQVGSERSPYFFSEEDAINTVEDFRNRCENGAPGAEFWSSNIFNVNGEYYFNWRCNSCKSPMVISEIESIREGCKNNCLAWEQVKCNSLPNGNIVESVLQCGMPVYFSSNNAETHHCPIRETSSSSEYSSSSEQSSSSINTSSSGGGSGGGTAYYDCFDDPDEALSAQEAASNICKTGNGFDGLYVNHIEELGYCIVGECKPYCYKTESEAETVKTHWDETCEESGSSPNYTIKLLDEDSNYYCVRGECENQSSSSQEESSSSEGGSSSSGMGDVFGKTCEIEDFYWNYMSGYGIFQKILYSSKPDMKNKDKIYVSGCSCSGEAFSCRIENFNYIHNYIPYSMPLCGFSNGYWCSGIDKDGSCDFSGASAVIYRLEDPSAEWFSVNMANTGYYPIGESSSIFGLKSSSNPQILSEEFFHHAYALPQNVSYSDLESAILSALPDFPTLNHMNAYCRGEWVPHDEDCYGTENEVRYAVADSTSECSYLGGTPQYSQEFSSRGYCVVGECVLESSSSSFEEPSSSSSFEESSSSSEDASSSSVSSSSEASLCGNPTGYGPPLNGGYGTCINVGGKCYECNKERSRAECESPWLWDGSQVAQTYWFSEVSCNGSSSSSSEEASSSSESSICGNPTGYGPPPNGGYGTCINVGGKCYECNKERSRAECESPWLWDGNQVGQTYWFSEVNCYGTKPVEEITSGGCKENKRGPNAVYEIGDCFYSGLDNMEPGKCYSINPARGRQTGWINNNAQDKWWWIEAPCGEEEEEETEICSDGFLWDDEIDSQILYKANSEEANNSNYELPWRSKSYIYDALGRKTFEDRNTKRFLFNGKSVSDNSPNLPFLLREAPIKIGKESCGVWGKDYGYVKDGMLYGGKTCWWVNTPIRKSDIEQAIVTDFVKDPVTDSVVVCGKNKKLTRKHGEIPIEISLSIQKIYYVREGDTIKGLNAVLGMSTINKETEIKMCRHEVGHMNDHSRVIPNKKISYITLDEIGCGCIEAENKALAFLRKARKDTADFYENLIYEADAKYHSDYGLDRAPSNAECPNK